MCCVLRGSVTKCCLCSNRNIWGTFHFLDLTWKKKQILKTTGWLSLILIGNLITHHRWILLINVSTARRHLLIRAKLMSLSSDYSLLWTVTQTGWSFQLYTWNGACVMQSLCRLVHVVTKKLLRACRSPSDNEIYVTWTQADLQPR